MEPSGIAYAVTSSGRMIPGKGYWERLFNPTKLDNVALVEHIIRREDCFARISDGHPERDSIIFAQLRQPRHPVGCEPWRFQIVASFI